ncbi:MAG: hypothetical protein K5Q00_06640, partial [Gammaproteobacteria bacterium]|nr:hypothetical protein [Gammaproteobacteria bacterium]
YYNQPNKNLDALLSLPETSIHIADNDNEVFFLALQLEFMGVVMKLLTMENVAQVFRDNEKLRARAIAQLITLGWVDVLDLIPQASTNKLKLV